MINEEIKKNWSDKYIDGLPSLTKPDPSLCQQLKLQ